MANNTKGYAPLRSEDDNTSDDEQHRLARSDYGRPNATYIINFILLIALFLSVTTNFVLGLLHWPLEDQRSELVQASLYAGLNRKLSIPYTLDSPYSIKDDRESTDRSWEAIEIDAGVVALSDSFVSQKGLPGAMRFPWDETKGVYFINAYHNLHCLKKVYRSLNEFDRNLEQSGSFAHVIHCLDTLRQDVLCSADDTPRYTVMKKETPTGGGQYRECRDWSQLEAWAQDQTACWKYVNSTDPDANQMERFKYCPEGSPYLEKAREVFPDSSPQHQ